MEEEKKKKKKTYYKEIIIGAIIAFLISFGLFQWGDNQNNENRLEVLQNQKNEQIRNEEYCIRECNDFNAGCTNSCPSVASWCGEDQHCMVEVGIKARECFDECSLRFTQCRLRCK